MEPAGCFHLDLCPPCVFQHHPHKQSFQNGARKGKSEEQKGSMGLASFGHFPIPRFVLGRPRDVTGFSQEHLASFPGSQPERLGPASAWSLPRRPLHRHLCPLGQLLLDLLEIRQLGTATSPRSQKQRRQQSHTHVNILHMSVHTYACLPPPGPHWFPDLLSNTYSSDPNRRPSLF